MELLTVTIPENTYVLSNKEIDVIHAIAAYFSSVPIERTGMTKTAYDVVCNLEEQFRMHQAKNCCKVWV